MLTKDQQQQIAHELACRLFIEFGFFLWSVPNPEEIGSRHAGWEGVILPFRIVGIGTPTEFRAQSKRAQEIFSELAAEHGYGDICVDLCVTFPDPDIYIYRIEALD